MTDEPQAPKSVIITREELAGHIDDPVCTCARCHPEWHTGVRCNCETCREIRAASGRSDGGKSQVTYLTVAQAAELTRRRETLSLECGAMSATLRCAGCDRAATEGRGPCLHDCHDEELGVVDLSDLVERRTGRPVAKDAYELGWVDGVRWAAAEADAQASWREPVYILDITDHLRACAATPNRGSAVPRDAAPADYADDVDEPGPTGILDKALADMVAQAEARGKAESAAELQRLRDRIHEAVAEEQRAGRRRR